MARRDSLGAVLTVGALAVLGYVGYKLYSGVSAPAASGAPSVATPAPTSPAVTPGTTNSQAAPTVSAPGPRTETPGINATNYVIQAGETLSGIAARFGTSVEELARLNGIPDPDHILAGASLRIPGAGASPTGGYFPAPLVGTNSTNKTRQYAP